ncbi:MAG: PH domain-containing protein [Planctomycetes bacterium]|nr:PH domain-containing protein [Planctomycetota bacterium]
MYESLKRLALSILRVPAEQPEEPAGTHDSVVIFRASPRFLAYLMLPMWIGLGVTSLALMAAATVVGVVLLQKDLAWLGAVVWVIGIALILVKATVFYVTTRLNYEMRWYIVTDRSLRIREGVWLMREVTLTFANVQNLNVTQGPLQRYFGISDLIVETAGGGVGRQPGGESMMLGHHGVLRGIENALEVRDRIQALLRAYRAAGLGDPDDKHAAAPQGVAEGGDMLEVLRGMRDEAKRLRTAVGA